MIDQGGINGRCASHTVYRVLLDDLQVFTGIESGQDIDGHAAEDGVVQIGDRAHGMEPGDHIDDHVVCPRGVEVFRIGIFHDLISQGRGHPVPDLRGVDDRIVMGDHGALGKPGGPSGISQNGDIFLSIDRHPGRAGRIFFDQILEKVDPGFRILENGGDILPFKKQESLFLYQGKGFLQAGNDDSLQPGLLFHLEQFFHQELELEGYDRLGPGIIQLVFEFFLTIEGRTHGEDSPDFQDRIIGNHKLRAIGHEKGHPISLFDSRDRSAP